MSYLGVTVVVVAVVLLLLLLCWCCALQVTKEALVSSPVHNDTLIGFLEGPVILGRKIFVKILHGTIQTRWDPPAENCIGSYMLQLGNLSLLDNCGCKWQDDQLTLLIYVIYSHEADN